MERWVVRRSCVAILLLAFAGELKTACGSGGMERTIGIIIVVEIASFLRGSLAGTSKSRKQGQHRPHQLAYHPTHAQIMALRCGYARGSAQRLMRHTDIRTTMNVYGTAVTANMRLAHTKIVRLALQRA